MTPIGWVFQHDETGRMAFCENDGINTPEVFAELNPRYMLVSPAYSTPPPASQSTDPRAQFDSSGKLIAYDARGGGMYGPFPASQSAPSVGSGELPNKDAATLLDSMAWQVHPDTMSHDDAGSLWVWAQDAAGMIRRLATAGQVPTVHGGVTEAEIVALVAGPSNYHHKMNERQVDAAKTFDHCRDLTIENIRQFFVARSLAGIGNQPATAGQGVEVDDAMVERAAYAMRHADSGQYIQEHYNGMARAALKAALAAPTPEQR